MIQSTREWALVERSMRERAYRKMADDPMMLLEHDSCFQLDADLFHARLIGLDDEIVRDCWIRSVMPVILLPIPLPPRLLVEEQEALLWSTASLPTARYVLQNGYVTLSVAGEHGPPVEQLRSDGTVVVAYLRYRRRL